MTSPQAAGRDVILGAVERYDWEALAPFFESLRATGYDGEIRFFAHELPQATAAALGAAGVELETPRSLRLRVHGHSFAPYNDRTTRIRWHVQPLYRHVVRAATALAPDRRAARTLVYSALSNLSVARFFWYYRFLARNVARYRNVMLTDVRDVLFLRSPFAFEIGDRVHCFLEDEHVAIGEQEQNRGWVHGAFGVEGLRRVESRPISCAGVTIGRASAVLEYLTVMVDQLVRLRWQWNGIEQGVHNYVLHTGLVPRAALHPNLAGPVLTIGIMPPEQALAAFEERAPELCVVHQYDRHPEIGERILALVAPRS